LVTFAGRTNHGGQRKRTPRKIGVTAAESQTPGRPYLDNNSRRFIHPLHFGNNQTVVPHAL
jgi:hypothetical protein